VTQCGTIQYMSPAAWSKCPRDSAQLGSCTTVPQLCSCTSSVCTWRLNQLDTPRKRPAHWEPSQLLELAASKAAHSTAFDHAGPERLMGEEYSFESDVWSMGVIILEALHGRPLITNDA